MRLSALADSSIGVPDAGSPAEHEGVGGEGWRFRSTEEVRDPVREACAANPDLAAFHDLGRSEEGRPLYGVTLGYGPRTVTLVAGAHADEPVGPETLRTLVLDGLAQRDWLADDEGLHALFERVTFRILPHVNPDAEARNRPWIEQWPDPGADPGPAVEAYLRHRLRERPGRDVEFGYPVLRRENRLASRFLFDYTPLALHLSLHGMGFAEGALLLVERHWAGHGGPDRTERLRAGWVEAVRAAGLRLHDQDRSGDKGFRYLGPGFWTTPEGTAMRRYFRQRGDEETAARFFCSSMEMARLAGYDADRERHPLCLVTELPLFVIERAYGHEPGVPQAYLDLLDRLPVWQRRLEEGASIRGELDPFEIRPLDLRTAVRLQLRAIELGLEAVAGNG